MLTWGELSERLQVSRAMLDFVRTGKRNPSPKLRRRIANLETEAGIAPAPRPKLVARESAEAYDPNSGKKRLDYRDLRRQVLRLQTQVGRLRTMIENGETGQK